MTALRTAPAVLGALLLLYGAQDAQGYPLLQLDIKGGKYDTKTETTFATSQAFTLYAYLTPPNNTSAAALSSLLDETYYIAAAVAPKVYPPGADLGTFTFNNTTVRATQDMVYGDPPLERYLGGSATFDPGDLAKHDIYETFFTEFTFKFNPAQRAVAYDAAVNTGSTVAPSPTGKMYYMEFKVDTSKLDPRYQIHFDMFSEVVKRGGDIDISKFAPFSHDAQSMVMPEPGTLILVGSGVAALAARHRRRKRGGNPQAPAS